jgi:hypothetical protein
MTGNFLNGPPIDTDYLTARRWWKDVEIGNPADCWPWLKSCGSHGYGQTWDKVTVRLTHRVAWTLTYGPIPEGMTVDHECRNRRCCNPNPGHLRLKTNVDNATDNGNHRKTHCKWGHEFTEGNTRMTKQGHRACRTCQQKSNTRRKF